ncbi:MAG TPA: DsrE family protein [Candidatus Acidoferrales bacterium]|jgi:intracellular sulfur oxidation DsrE/DsrF family protein|nr:DsrE family protein [Candidatus Acidoferrales bacterium]
MKKRLFSAICTAAATALLIAISGPAMAQTAQVLPIPEAPVAANIPSAHELPDPNLTYRIAFGIKNPAPKIDEINPGLISVARYFNTLALNGVPADHRKIVVVFHGAPIFLNNDAYKARNEGHDNPNIALIRSMKKAGIDFRVCGQELLAMKIDLESVLPEVQIDLWAMTTVTNLQTRGYIYIAGN